MILEFYSFSMWKGIIQSALAFCLNSLWEKKTVSLVSFPIMYERIACPPRANGQMPGWAVAWQCGMTVKTLTFDNRPHHQLWQLSSRSNPDRLCMQLEEVVPNLSDEEVSVGQLLWPHPRQLHNSTDLFVTYNQTESLTCREIVLSKCLFPYS